MTIFNPGLKDRAVLILFLLFPGLLYSQSQSGRVISGTTNYVIAFANVAIIGKNIGTVSDAYGNFTINLDNTNDKDSLRFSMIGYDSKSLLIKQFKEDTIKNVYLTPRSYKLQEVKVVVYKRKVKEVELGSPVNSSILKSGFDTHILGSELGIKVDVRGRVRLMDMHLEVATCTFDSVKYRLNIYQAVDDKEYKNILTKPIYISFSKDQIRNVLTFDLREHSIYVEGDILITLELYRDLGEGKLLFRTQYFTDYTYHRKTREGSWIKSAGAIGMYLHGQKIK